MLHVLHDLHDPAVLAAAIAAAAGLFVAVRARGRDRDEHNELMTAVVQVAEDVGAIRERLDAMERRGASRRRRPPVDDAVDGLGTTT